MSMFSSNSVPMSSYQVTGNCNSVHYLNYHCLKLTRMVGFSRIETATHIINTATVVINTARLRTWGFTRIHLCSRIANNSPTLCTSGCSQRDGGFANPSSRPVLDRR